MFWPQDWLWARELRKICINYNFQVYRQCQKLKECTSWYLQFMDLKTFNCVAKSTCRTEHLYAEIKLQLNAWTCPCFERSVHLSTWAHFQQPWLLNSADILCYVCRCLLVFSVILTAGLSGSSFWALVDILRLVYLFWPTFEIFCILYPIVTQTPTVLLYTKFSPVWNWKMTLSLIFFGKVCKICKVIDIFISCNFYWKG